MKFYTLILSMIMFGIGCFAQTDVTLIINHQLGGEEFAMNTAAQNNLGEDFDVTRLQYYISEITLKHDGGVETLIPDLWILVDAEFSTEVALGNLNVNSVEGVSFGVGVDSAHNHLDPSMYSSGHPLAPVFPSMHWGWDPGYRFIAFEGNGGPNLDQTIQIHGLDDINYFKTNCRTDFIADNNKLSIELNADYTRLLEDMTLSSGVFVHGRSSEAKQILENARDFVFTAAKSNSGISQPDYVDAYNIFPNPTSNGIVSVELQTDDYSGFTISVRDMLGKRVSLPSLEIAGESILFQLPGKGIYLMELNRKGKVIMTRTVYSY